jgi:hypothetical protein
MGVRLAMGAGGTGDRSAVVMATLLIGGAWLSATLLSSPRRAFLVTLGLAALLDMAALPPRFDPGYDAREAFYRPDQVLTAQVQVAAGLDRSRAELTLLVEPIFPASANQPRFGLAGTIDDLPVEWDCPFTRGRQQLALPVSAAGLSASNAVDVRIHLTGSPSRESDYLLAYRSTRRGGFLVSLVDQADLDSGVTSRCLMHVGAG